MSTQVIDARGLSCPQPVIATKKALDAMGEGVVTTIVDNAAARENVAKFAAANGCGVSIAEKDGHFYLSITKGAPLPDNDKKAANQTGDVVYLITRDTLGHGSDELGAILMKAFFYTLGEIEPLPRAILLLNSGVKLAVEGSPVVEYLASYAESGVKVLSCGTCLDYFKLKDRLAAGGVTNMYTLLAELPPGKTITL
ncbi:sulfurtransferase-like selenium metabolism protein YedF [Anaeroselena agilis]|uniref:Sulfurtransferase-like selenium metabolism protein YedF n=1 Tax=Anaeroselena agilis TaxID=3063788 RepID=A0ABU3NTL3_9FIRM|nr:sulfurtransferase-like selenium metabolism protein YedF [Selenomonadales bacterium 4137-cl]